MSPLKRPSASHDAAPGRRAQRSRVGLILFLVVMLGGAYELGVRSGTLPLPSLLRGLGRALGGSSDLGRMAYQAQPYVGFGLTPDYDWSSGTKTNNNLGFRGPDTTVEKPAGVYRIVCLGGSTTFSDQVQDDETYPVHLQRMLRELRPGLNVEVINAGVPSYTTAESLANLAFRVLELQPDMVVIYHGANDVRPRVYADFEASYFHYRKPWDGSDRLQERTSSGDMAGGINTLVQHAPADDGGDLAARKAANAAHAAHAGTAAFRRNLVSMVGMARAHGVTPVLVTFAGKGPDPDSLPGLLAGIAEHNAVIADVSREHGVALIDLDRKLSRDGTFAAPGGTHDQVHLNAKGTLEKAAIIAEGLAPLIP